MQRNREDTMKKIAALIVAALTLPLWAQNANEPASATAAGRQAGDIAPLPILAAMKKVADWQLTQPPRHPADDWTCAAEYTGMMALSQVSADPKYHDAMMAMGQKQEWKPAKRVYDADDHCVCQTYLELYLQHRDDRAAVADGGFCYGYHGEVDLLGHLYGPDLSLRGGCSCGRSTGWSNPLSRASARRTPRDRRRSRHGGRRRRRRRGHRRLPGAARRCAGHRRRTTGAARLCRRRRGRYGARSVARDALRPCLGGIA